MTSPLSLIIAEHSDADRKGLLNVLREENADEQDLEQIEDFLV